MRVFVHAVLAAVTHPEITGERLIVYMCAPAMLRGGGGLTSVAVVCQGAPTADAR